MLNLDIANQYSGLPQLGTTLWHCQRCDAFISIHSARAFDEAFCPACAAVPLEFCGRLNGIPGIQFGDA